MHMTTTKLVLLTTRNSALPERCVDGDTHQHMEVWQSGTLLDIITRFQADRIDYVIRQAQRNARAAHVRDALEWYADEAKSRAAVAATFDPVHVEVFDNELAEPPLAEEVRLNRVQAIQAVVQVLEDLEKDATAYAKDVLRGTLYNLRQTAARVASGAL